MRLVYSGFVLTGIVNTLLGPVLPMLSQRWSLDDADAGLLFTVQFVGSMLGVGLSSALTAGWGATTMLAIGSGLMAIGVGTLLPASWPASLVFVFCYGVGLGFAIPVTNLLVADAYPHRRAAALNLVNLAWVVGAVAGPAVLALFARFGRSELFLPGLAIALVLVAAMHARRAWIEPRPMPAADHPVRRHELWRTPALALFVALFFLYSGTESAVGGWVASYAQRMPATAAGVAVLAPAFFWGALLVGRALAPAVLARISDMALINLGLVLATVALVMLLNARTSEGVVLSATLGGLGLAPVFPTTMALMARAFEGAASRAAGPTFAAAGLGGAIVPWLVGMLSTRFDSLRTGLMVPLFGCLAMLALCVTFARRDEPRKEVGV